MATFYRLPGDLEAWYRDAPQFLFISWDHDRTEYGDGATLLDIKPLLKLRASTPSSKIKFKCRRLIEFDLPCAPCGWCGVCINCPHDAPDSHSDVDSLYDYPCSHEDTQDEVRAHLEVEYAYLNALNGFLDNKNETWLAAVRDGLQHPMQVHCTMGLDCGVPTIYIRFEKNGAPPLLQRRNMWRTAASYLTEMGIMALEERRDLDFVVGISTGKYMRPTPGIYPVMPTYDQSHICGDTYKAPAAAKAATDK